MHFLRAQEFYESPFPEFKGKNFNLIDYMEKYAKAYGDNVFTYPGDWCGFNIPSNVLKECYFGNILDVNNPRLKSWACARGFNQFSLIKLKYCTRHEYKI